MLHDTNVNHPAWIALELVEESVITDTALRRCFIIHTDGAMSKYQPRLFTNFIMDLGNYRLASGYFPGSK